MQLWTNCELLESIQWILNSFAVRVKLLSKYHIQQEHYSWKSFFTWNNTRPCSAMLSSFNKENYSMIGNRLEAMSKDYLRRYQKIPKLFSSTQAGINFIWASPDRVSVQPILKHLQCSNSAAFLNTIFKTSVIFTTRMLFWMYYLNHSGVQFILFPF